MSKANKKQSDRNYPFTEDVWGRWSNAKRLKWMRNFRDRLRENDDALGRKFGFNLEELRQLDEDVKTLEKLVIAESAKNN